MEADTETSTAALATLHQFADAYGKRDQDSMLALFARDPDVLIVGSRAGERHIDLPMIKTLLERETPRPRAVSIALDWGMISSAGSVAWVIADLVANVSVAAEKMSLKARLTIVL